ncbi:MAG: hypothetical protein COB66_05110 [Coxiella sp. (in: Bacteria)]|nr:MAG: hypothetical protein COB66_05110 [Coxiella sp. (in: g-proteobacteria)]
MRKFVEDLRARLVELEMTVPNPLAVGNLRKLGRIARLERKQPDVVKSRSSGLEFAPSSFGDYVFLSHINDFLGGYEAAALAVDKRNGEAAPEAIQKVGASRKLWASPRQASVEEGIENYIENNVEWYMLIMKFIVALPSVFHWEYNTRTETFHLEPNENCYQLTRLILDTITNCVNEKNGFSLDVAEMATDANFRSALAQVWLSANTQSIEYDAYVARKEPAMAAHFDVPSIKKDASYRDKMHGYFPPTCHFEKSSYLPATAMGSTVHRVKAGEIEHSNNKRLSACLEKVDQVLENVKFNDTLEINPEQFNEQCEKLGSARVKLLEGMCGFKFAALESQQINRLVGNLERETNALVSFIKGEHAALATPRKEDVGHHPDSTLCVAKPVQLQQRKRKVLPLTPTSKNKDQVSITTVLVSMSVFCSCGDAVQTQKRHVAAVTITQL